MPVSVFMHSKGSFVEKYEISHREMTEMRHFSSGFELRHGGSRILYIEGKNDRRLCRSRYFLKLFVVKMFIDAFAVRNMRHIL